MTPARDLVTVLFVDDEPCVLRAVGRALRKGSIEVLLAGSAGEAIELMQSQRVDVLVSDLDMPSMNGLELMRFARARFPGALRVLLSGAATVGALRDAINVGEIERFFEKPFDADSFRGTLDELTGRIEQSRSDERAQRVRARRHGFLAWLESRHPGIRDHARDELGRVRIDVDERLAEADASGSRARDALFPTR